MNNPRTMCTEEFTDLQREAGYPFANDEQAQRFRLRQVQAQAIERMLEGPHVEARRVDRD